MLGVMKFWMIPSTIIFSNYDEVFSSFFDLFEWGRKEIASSDKIPVDHEATTINLVRMRPAEAA